ncbi:MAG: hypothetical protein BRC54_06335 [Cyanobacteria bacterium SW_7_48_12]|nr:MAG: hypothetical protein BRC54_06335 [Cyanobacteria bacterium SW_7_48_12]
MGKTNPGKNENPDYSGVSTNTLTGDATAFETGSSELSFERYSFSTENDNTFSLGNLTYFNGKALYNTGVSSVPLSVELKFTAPNGSTEAFSSDFNLVSTSNMGTAEEKANSVSLVSDMGDRNFNVDGTDYTLELTGFSQDSDATVDQLRTLEGKTTTAQVLGQITEAPSSVSEPEPASEPVSELASQTRPISEPEPVSEPQSVPEPTTTLVWQQL